MECDQPVRNDARDFEPAGIGTDVDGSEDGHGSPERRSQATIHDGRWDRNGDEKIARFESYIRMMKRRTTLLLS
jgi:hypothetical protein